MWKKLGGRWVLRDVNIEAPASAVTVLLGPNGAGKTTLLRVLAGLYSVDRGEVLVAGMAPKDARRRGLLVLAPDEMGLYPRLTGREHLEVASELYGCRWSRLEEAVELLGLKSVVDKRVEVYSRGMQAKLKLLMALATCAQVVLLDEPLTGLDIASVYAAIEILGWVTGEGRSVVLSTHELWVAERIAEWLVVLDEGRVLAQGETRRLLEEHNVSSIEEYLARFVYGVGRLG